MWERAQMTMYKKRNTDKENFISNWVWIIHDSIKKVGFNPSQRKEVNKFNKIIRWKNVLEHMVWILVMYQN